MLRPLILCFLFERKRYQPYFESKNPSGFLGDSLTGGGSRFWVQIFWRQEKIVLYSVPKLKWGSPLPPSPHSRSTFLNQDIWLSLSPPLRGRISLNKGGTVRYRDLTIFWPLFWPFSLVKSPKRGSKIAKIFRLRRAFPPSISIVPPLFRRPRRTPKMTLFWSVSPLITAK